MRRISCRRELHDSNCDKWSRKQHRKKIRRCAKPRSNRSTRCTANPGSKRLPSISVTRRPDNKNLQPESSFFERTPKRPLKIFVDFPPDWKQTDRRAAIVFWHGGAGCSGPALCSRIGSAGVLGCSDAAGRALRQSLLCLPCLRVIAGLWMARVFLR